MQNIMLLANLSKRQIAQLEKQYKQYVMCDFTEILSQFCSLRQPNQQARQAAPFIKKKQIKTIENDESSVRFIVTRHPFHRFIKTKLFDLCIFKTFDHRLLSAFRDKLERCTPDFDCTKRNDW